MDLEFKEGKIVPISIEDEMRKSYINYAMSVIVERALPDVRDGLKPVQRRILYAMSELGLRHDRPFKKSASVVGEVMGKYHPHGDSAIYDAMVRMAQPFSYRYMLVHGHGNFGSVDGDPPAAMRYTEAKLSRIAGEMLRDIDKNTVDFVPNYDDSLEQPSVLPSRYPNLLVNGASGIAVGMATNIPPHNLGEVIDALEVLIDDPDVSIRELTKKIKGPDFPTGAQILGRDGIRSAYETGRGSIKTRAKAHIEQLNNGKSRIIVTEIPYMVNKARLIEKIAELVRDKKIDGISELNDESDRTGMRIMIGVKKDANPQVILNRLYKHTQLQETFGVIMLALVNQEPKVLNLKDMLQLYLEYQKDIIIRRTRFELEKAQKRAHILEGYRIALDNIDEIIKLIRAAETEAIAKEGLMKKFALTEVQAEAILALQLRRLTGLEREKVEEEYQQLLKTIAHLKEILGDMRLVYQIIRDELQEIREKYADDRRTEITADEGEIDIEDLIADEEVLVTITHQGYIKRLPIDTYRSQRRGGRGISALHTKKDDFAERIFVAKTHTYVLFFTNKGRVYRLRGYEIPEASRNAKGTALINLLQLEKNERIEASIPVKDFEEDKFLILATKDGNIKKTRLSEFRTHRVGGLISISLRPDDEVVAVKQTEGSSHVVIVTKQGQAIRFPEDEVRPMGRSAQGVRAVRLNAGCCVIAMDVFPKMVDAELLIMTEKGYGKRTPLSQYRCTRRGGKGIRAFTLSEKTGNIAGARIVQDGNEVMLISAEGIMIRTPVENISRQGRSAQGIRVMRTGENDRIVDVAQTLDKADE